MSIKTAIYSYNFMTVGSTIIRLNGMFDIDGRTSIAIHFRESTWATGLSASFHGTTAEMRALGAELIRHADITDAAVQATEQPA